MNYLAVLIIVALLLVGIGAGTASIRRNKKMIDAFDEPELSELRICLHNRSIQRTHAKLEALGWDLVQSEVAPEDQTRSHVLFRKRSGDTAAPIKEVLHWLNRSLLLPIRPFELKRPSEETTD